MKYSNIKIKQKYFMTVNLTLLMLAGTLCTANELTPGQIEEKASKLLAENSYQVTQTIRGRGTPLKMTFYQKMNPDGTVYTLLKPVNTGGLTILDNAKGRFEIIGETAIRADHERLKLPPPPPPLPRPIRKDENTFIIEGREVRRDMISPRAFEIFSKLADGKISELSSYALKKEDPDLVVKKINYGNRFCYQLRLSYKVGSEIQTAERIVDCESFIPYQSKIFNGSGKLISDITYSDFKLNPDFDKRLFDLPSSLKIVNTKDKEATDAAIKNASQELFPQKKATSTRSYNGVANSLSNLFWSHISVVSYVLAGMAMVMMIIVAILRKSKRRTFTQ